MPTLPSAGSPALRPPKEGTQHWTPASNCCLLTTIDIKLLRNSVNEVSCGVDDSAYEVEGGNLNSVNKSLISQVRNEVQEIEVGSL